MKDFPNLGCYLETYTAIAMHSDDLSRKKHECPQS